MRYILEICAGSLSSALAAREGNADRVELCDNLSEGGTTPSYGMIRTVKSLLTIPVFPIIRPRGGDFVYSDEEFEAMKQDVLCCRELGCEGVVFGILLANGAVDVRRCSELVRLAGSMQITFHRAFDRCSDRKRGLEDIVAMGFHRILTSGGEQVAEEAITELKNLVSLAENRITIMPGSGITHRNLLKIAVETGATEFHTTAKRETKHGDVQKDMASVSLYETDLHKVVELRRLLDERLPAFRQELRGNNLTR